MRALGLAGAYRSVTEDPAVDDTTTTTEDHRDNDLVEPRMITGEGPTGKSWGIGRGPLTGRDMRRIVHTVEYRQWLADNGGGEEE